MLLRERFTSLARAERHASLRQAQSKGMYSFEVVPCGFDGELWHGPSTVPAPLYRLRSVLRYNSRRNRE
jgi:hypothetical protein